MRRTRGPRHDLAQKRDAAAVTARVAINNTTARFHAEHRRLGMNRPICECNPMRPSYRPIVKSRCDGGSN